MREVRGGSLQRTCPHPTVNSLKGPFLLLSCSLNWSPFPKAVATSLSATLPTGFERRWTDFPVSDNWISCFSKSSKSTSSHSRPPHLSTHPGLCWHPCPMDSCQEGPSSNIQGWNSPPRTSGEGWGSPRVYQVACLRPSHLPSHRHTKLLAQ